MDLNFWTEFDNWGRIGCGAVLGLLWQSSLLFAAVGAVAWLLRRRAAEGRCRLWIAALLVTPLLPGLTEIVTRAGVPQAELGVLPRSSAARGDRSGPAPEGTSLSSAPASAAVRGPMGPMQPLARSGRVSPAAVPPEPSVLDYPWALGVLAYAGSAALLLALVALGQVRVRRWTGRAAPVADTRARGAFDAACAALRLTRVPRLLEHPRLPTPLAVGVLRPTILLPREHITSWSDTELRAILIHELAHIRRGDPIVLQLVAITRALLFFHPLVWLVARRIVTLAEQAADVSVVEAQVEPLPYAKLLTRLAEGLRGRMPLGDVAGIALPKSTFLERIEAILALPENGTKVRGLTGIALVATLFAVLSSLALALLVPLGPRSQAAEDRLRVQAGRQDERISEEARRTLNVSDERESVALPPRILRFPEDLAVGTVEVRPAGSSDFRSTTDSGGWKRLAEARGDVTVPGGSDVRLNVSKEGAGNLSFLENFGASDLFGLSLAFTEVQDSDLAGLRYLSHLEELSLVETPITDDGLAPVGELSHLRSLSIGQGKIGDAGLAHLAGLENLEVLDARSSSIRGPGLANLEGLTRLHTLYLGSNEIDDEGLRYLPILPSLENLYLWSNPITDASVPHLARFVGLRWLDFWATKVTDEGLVHLRGMPELRTLRFDGTAVGDAGMAHLAAVRSLEELYLSRTTIGDEGVAHLAQLPRLRRLNLSSTRITSASLSTLSRVRSLESLDVTDTAVDDAALVQFVGHPDLSSLRLDELTDAGLESLSGIPRLKRLFVTGEARISGRGLELLSRLPIEELQLSGEKLSNESIHPLARLTGLKRLSLNSGRISDEGIHFVAEIENLERFTLQQAQITGAGLLPLRELKKLAEVGLYNTTITAAGLVKLRQALPRVKVFVYPDPLPDTSKDNEPLDWERFHRLYSLEEGQVLKRIPPPFVPERLERYRRRSPHQAELIPRGPDRMVFHWDGALSNWGMGFGTGGNLDYAMRYVVRIPRNEYVASEELREVELPGDWIVRKDATKERLLDTLVDILSIELGRRVTVERGEVERDVFVARGTYAFRPAPATFGPKSIHLYSDGLSENEGAGGGSGTLREMFEWIGNRTGATFVDETESSDVEVSWYNHRSTSLKALSEKPERLDLLVENLEKQTGLELERETRTVGIWELGEK